MWYKPLIGQKLVFFHMKDIDIIWIPAVLCKRNILNVNSRLDIEAAI